MSGPAVWLQVLAVGAGAAIGAVLRWLAGLWLNAQWNGFPLGTLLVNCVGGFLVGIALVWFTRSPNELMRLLLVTGFLGGLTTFSAYSVESLILLQRGFWGLAAAHTLAHVCGALAFAVLGFALARAALN